mgnify:FL=1
MSQQLKEWKAKGQYYRHRGHAAFYRMEGSGQALLICHGYPYNTYDFKEIWPSLTSMFQVIAPDMLGMGFSDKPSNYDYSFEDHANFYADLLYHLGISKVHILSHDLGNSVVQELLARQQSGSNSFEILSISFLNGGLFTDVYKPRLIQKLLSQTPPPIGKLISRLMSKSSVSRATAEVFGAATKPSVELLHDFWEILNYNNGKLLAWKIGRLIFDKEPHQSRWIAAMQQTKVPMIFINGPADPNSGIHMANRYKELIPNPQIILLPEATGHWPQLEAPVEVLQAFSQFHQSLHANSKPPK